MMSSMKSQPISESEMDQQLIIGIASGDRNAFKELYNKYASSLLGIARSFLGNQQDAEDLLHDVFIEFWNKAKQYNPKRGTVRSWLSMRVRSRAIDRMRVLSKLEQYSSLEKCSKADSSDCDKEIDSESDKALIHKALTALTRRQRLVIEFGYFRGLSYQEIAIQCDIPIGTVKSRLSAAVDKLRQQLLTVSRVL